MSDASESEPAIEVEGGEMSVAAVAQFLSRPVLARLASADPRQCRPHVVPVWFYWDGTSIWVSSFQDTRKVKDLLANPACSILIDDAQSGLDYQAVLCEGQAELIRQPQELVHEMSELIYARYLGEEEVKKARYQEWIYAPENLLIRLTPEKMKTWYSARKGS